MINKLISVKRKEKPVKKKFIAQCFLAFAQQKTTLG